MRRYLAFSICVMVLTIVASHCAAGVIPLTVDSNTSFLSISIDGQPFQQSPVSGTANLDLSGHSATSGTAQITTLDLTATNGLSFPITIPLFGSVTASTAGGDVSFSLVAPGAAGAIVPGAGGTGGSFVQTANQIALDGDVTIGNLLGSTTFDLDTVNLPPTDFNNLSVVQSGNTFTIGGGFVIAQELDAAGAIIALDVDGQFFASGTKPVPDPGSAVILIGMGWDGSGLFDPPPAIVVAEHSMLVS